MNRSNCHFRRLQFWFWLWHWLWLWLWQFVASNQRQPVNWKVLCNYKSFFIILWYFSVMLLHPLIFCSSVHTILAKLASCKANVFATGSNAQRSVAATVTETDPTHVWLKLKWKWKWKCTARNNNNNNKNDNVTARNRASFVAPLVVRGRQAHMSYACFCVLAANAKLISFCSATKGKWQLQKRLTWISLNTESTHLKQQLKQQQPQPCLKTQVFGPAPPTTVCTVSRRAKAKWIAKRSHLAI